VFGLLRPNSTPYLEARWSALTTSMRLAGLSEFGDVTIPQFWDRDDPSDADQARIGFLLTVESTLGMLASRQSRGAVLQGLAV
jgi:hypothetical protein